MESLTLTCARERRRFGQNSLAPPSRFLDEIPSSALTEESRSAFDDGPDLGSHPRSRAGKQTSRDSSDYDYDQSGGDSGDGVRVGLRVRHPVFGLGTIENVIGTGEGQTLKIQFDRAGLKTVMVKFANLELG